MYSILASIGGFWGESWGDLFYQVFDLLKQVEAGFDVPAHEAVGGLGKVGGGCGCEALADVVELGEDVVFVVHTSKVWGSFGFIADIFVTFGNFFEKKIAFPSVWSRMFFCVEKISSLMNNLPFTTLILKPINL